MNIDRPTTLSRSSTAEEREFALRQIYTQVLERQPHSSERSILAKAEKDFLSGKLGVRHFLKELTTSSLYLDSFYYGCSNLKFLEWCIKHLLGRAPIDQEEIRTYSDILIRHGIAAIIGEILGSEEYRTAFGGFTVPYARAMRFYPSTKNFLQSDLLNHDHVGHRGKAEPTVMYWKQLGLNCASGVCEVDVSSRPSTSVSTPTLGDEIEDLIRMLQAEDAKTVAQQISGTQRSLIRKLAK
jgi:phycoerythrin-associated linker protein